MKTVTIVIRTICSICFLGMGALFAISGIINSWSYNVFEGTFLMILGVYLFASTLATIDTKKTEKENDAISQLAQYKTLMDTGVISPREFEAKKKDLLRL